MTPTFLTYPDPLSAVAVRVPEVDSTVRLSLDAVRGRRAGVDGAWWPYSRDAAAELPGLIAAVDQRLGRTTLRVEVRMESWENVPRQIPARGRRIRVGRFHGSDPRLITLILSDGEPIVLLVIPPDTIGGGAGTALGLTARDAAHLCATLRGA
ncbi:hypothetical protein HNP84_008338 [Thermocatellispora tengchongensis]|uniref:Uncharacterized protein n=1 Tax=Thermocatellispora tengchongensis TaxID=1073253 RepID=A0A840PB13_9ACTN|nr:DUF5994 family protein [Thermocatellispora tengchongensis]MBB5138584.1 hypothetical protein [Thermocatellispora tengchongensis]